MIRDDQRFIRTGWANPYLHTILGVVTFSGLLYVSGGLPAYDPAVLRLSPRLVWVLYGMLGAGGLIAYLGLVVAWWDKPVSLWLRLCGLGLQGWAGLVLAVSTVAVAGRQAAFIAPFAVLVVVGHAVQIWQDRRELRQAAVKIRVGRSI